MRFDEEAMLRKLVELDDSEFARFLMLCSIAHYGSNRYGSNRVDQSEIVQLSAERGVAGGLAIRLTTFDQVHTEMA